MRAYVHACVRVRACARVYCSAGGQESGQGAVTGESVQSVLKEFEMDINVNDLVTSADWDQSGYVCDRLLSVSSMAHVLY